MKWIEIAALPTVLIPGLYGGAGVHESVLRTFQAHHKVVDYLRRGVPGDVVLELLDELDLMAALIAKVQRVDQVAIAVTTEKPPEAPVS